MRKNSIENKKEVAHIGYNKRRQQPKKKKKEAQKGILVLDTLQI